ncbi:protein similar isoform X2 [Sabethes cyaneus]|uniref:protein similar isoform X2 n=1 Tax=Sabethes cyaneus TaxID=53552 RepID=UPI00237DBC8A|nr:protein similar isoform X2 [Sabethes cyaneus]
MLLSSWLQQFSIHRKAVRFADEKLSLSRGAVKASISLDQVALVENTEHPPKPRVGATVSHNRFLILFPFSAHLLYPFCIVLYFKPSSLPNRYRRVNIPQPFFVLASLARCGPLGNNIYNQKKNQYNKKKKSKRISGVENKDEIYSCAQLEARQQKSTTESPTSVASEADSVAVTDTPVKTSDKVLRENINHINTDNHTTKPELLSEDTAKKKSLTEEVIKVLGTGKCIIRKVTAASVPRPVSVTASIFNPVPKKELPAVAINTGDKTTTTTALLRKVPQSVTAKLFVTFNPQTAGGGAPPDPASTAAPVNCNKPKHATDSIFAPRTQDMNKGFLMFSEEEPGLTMLKDEPDDLTHLAPTAGDACIPLEETGPFFNDVFDDFMIVDNYQSLLEDELSCLESAEHRLGSSGSISVTSVASPLTVNGTITMVNHHNPQSSSTASSQFSSHSSLGTASPSPSLSSSSSSSLSSPSTASSPLNMSAASPSGTSGIGTVSSLGSASVVSRSSSTGQNCHTVDPSSNDPFINYRDEICEVSHSPHLLSPGLSKSPEGSSIPSLCSPNGSGCPEDELAFMTLNMEDDLDLSMRAPYISMSEVDDLPLLTSDDLMWGAPPVSIDGTTGAGKYTMIKQEYPAVLQQANATISSGKSKPANARTDLSSNNSTSNLNTSSCNSNINDNNCNVGNKIIDSSLAALLCGNVINIQTSTIQPNSNHQQILIQQQQPQTITTEQQQQQRELIGEKKIKLIESNMLHPMLVIAPGFKSSNTIETWTMNDLLQLNGAGTTTVSNASTTTTTSVTGSPKTNATVTATSAVSKKNSTHSSHTSTMPATNSHKRSHTTSESGGDTTSKRVKSTTSVSTLQQQQSPTSSPQLLQQLMAPSPVPAKAKSKSKAGIEQSEHRWAAGKLNGLQEQSSNSVLMNLLVSGCDNVAESPPQLLMTEEESNQGSTQKSSGLTDDEDSVPILANPMMSSGTPLTIQTEDASLILGKPSETRMDEEDDFMMTVSPSLLTPTDLEIWHAFKQNSFDPKRISTPTTYGGLLPLTGRTSLEMQMNLDEAGCGSLLTVLDPAMAISRMRSEEPEDEQDFEMTIPVNAILQNSLI